MLFPPTRPTDGPPLGMKCIIFVDDLNMPQKEEYGAQPPIELLRQWMDYSGWYDRDTKGGAKFRNIEDVQFITAMGPPGGGRNEITRRYTRHFNIVSFLPFDDDSLNNVFATIMSWYMGKVGMPKGLHACGTKIVAASIGIYRAIADNLLPTPAKSHYLFNLRDISTVFQGFMQFVPPEPGTSNEEVSEESLLRLWAHEIFRVFQDRLINEEDKDRLEFQLKRMMKLHTGKSWNAVRGSNSRLIYGDWIDPKAKVLRYVEVVDQRTQMKAVMTSYLEEYNMMSNDTMDLVLFTAAIEHVARIVRCIKQPVRVLSVAGMSLYAIRANFLPFFSARARAPVWGWRQRP